MVIFLDLDLYVLDAFNEYFFSHSYIFITVDNFHYHSDRFHVPEYMLTSQYIPKYEVVVVMIVQYLDLPLLM
jgi:hypothetical protein